MDRPPTLSPTIRNAALVAGAVLTATGRADLWTLAVAFGVANASALTALVVALAGVATIARAGSAGLADIAGTQAVLGAAGFTGSSLAIAAAWASALSLLFAGRDRLAGAGLGALGGLLVAGPSLAGGVTSALTWAAGAGIGGIAGWFFTSEQDDARARWQQWLAIGLGAVAVTLGMIAGYH